MATIMSWDDGKHTKVKSVRLTHDDVINSIEVVYDGTSLQSQRRGTLGAKSDGFTLDSDEYITEVTGYYKTTFTGDVITALTFKTNKKTYGPYGNKTRNFFSVTAPKDNQIAGFLGSSGNALISIDVHFAPAPTPGSTGSNIGGTNPGGTGGTGGSGSNTGGTEGGSGSNTGGIGGSGSNTGGAGSNTDGTGGSGSNTGGTGGIGGSGSNTGGTGGAGSNTGGTGGPGSNTGGTGGHGSNTGSTGGAGSNTGGTGGSGSNTGGSGSNTGGTGGSGSNICGTGGPGSNTGGSEANAGGTGGTGGSGANTGNTGSTTDSNLQKLEAQGGKGGNPWDDGADHDGVTKIHVAAGGQGINQIKFDYVKSEEPKEGPFHGVKGRSVISLFEITHPKEYLLSVKGWYDSSNIIQGIQFITNTKTSDYFGYEFDGDGTQFSLQVKDKKIVGFHGFADSHLNSIGAYFAPITSTPLKPSKKLQAVGGEEGASWDDGVFEGVKKIYVGQGTDGVSFVMIEYNKGSQIVIGDGHGKKSLLGVETFELDPDEYIIAMEGYYDRVQGDKGGVTLITSLIFKTNKQTSQPYGLTGGEHFELKEEGHKIVGFYGKAGDVVHSIGVYVAPITN